MDFRLTPEQSTFQADVRALLEGLVDADLHERVRASGAAHDSAIGLALGARGWLRDAMPGPGNDPVRLHLLFSEMEKAGAPYEALAVNLLVAGVLDAIGSELHRRTIVAPLLAGERNMCLGYSEPDAGSDLTAVSTRATSADEGWVLRGQKLWTTMAQDSAWMFALTCTDPTAPSRRGATMFVVPMDAPGVQVEAVHTMGGDRVNAVFLDNVSVGDEWRVGDVNGAWRVMSLALSLERGVLGNSQLAVPLLRAALDWLSSASGDDGVPFLNDPIVREEVAAIAIENQVGSLLGLLAAVDAAKGVTDGTAGSMVKVFVAERYVRAANRLQDLIGPLGLLHRGEPGAAARGEVEHHVRHSPVTRIAGGTTEINRNNIAERRLGLPRLR